MVDEVSNLIMEQLHILRRGQEAFQRGQEEMRADIADIKACMSGFESTLAHMMAHIMAQIATQNGRRIE